VHRGLDQPLRYREFTGRLGPIGQLLDRVRDPIERAFSTSSTASCVMSSMT
jgi:hypothetical protein